MTKLVIEGPPEEVGPFWTQFFSRPVGFGFFNTFYPEPPGLNTTKSARWRERHWGVSYDTNIQTMQNNPKAQEIDLRAIEHVVALKRIAGLFPKSKFTSSMTEIVLMPGLLRKPSHRPDIFDIRWHRCRYCGLQLTKHAKLQCLFASTYFTPVSMISRTVFGEYAWEPRSMSFVNTAGNTTTSTTIKASTADQIRAKPTSPKRKPSLTVKPET
jgi:hypothetical protein